MGLSSLKAATMPIVGIVLAHGTFQRAGISSATSRDNRAGEAFTAKPENIFLGEKKMMKGGGAWGKSSWRDWEVFLGGLGGGAEMVQSCHQE